MRLKEGKNGFFSANCKSNSDTRMNKKISAPAELDYQAASTAGTVMDAAGMAKPLVFDSVRRACCLQRTPGRGMNQTALPELRISASFRGMRSIHPLPTEYTPPSGSV